MKLFVSSPSADWVHQGTYIFLGRSSVVRHLEPPLSAQVSLTASIAY